MKRKASRSRRVMDHSLPGTPAADEMCLQSTEDAGSPPETGQGPTYPPPLCPQPLSWGSLSSPTIYLGGGSEQPGQGAGVKHPQRRLSWHQWSQGTGLPPPGLGWAWKSARQPTGPDLDECSFHTHANIPLQTQARRPGWLSYSHSGRQMGAGP